MDMQRNSFSPSFKSRPEEQVDKRQPIWPPSVCQADLLWSRNYAAEHCVWTPSATCKCHESKINRNPSIMAGPWRTTQSQSVVERCRGGGGQRFSFRVVRDVQRAQNDGLVRPKRRHVYLRFHYCGHPRLMFHGDFNARPTHRPRFVLQTPTSGRQSTCFFQNINQHFCFSYARYDRIGTKTTDRCRSFPRHSGQSSNAIRSQLEPIDSPRVKQSTDA